MLYELLDHIFGVLILDAKSLNQLAVCTFNCATDALISGSRWVQNIKGENDGQMVIPNHRTIGPDVFFFALVLSKPQKNYCELDDVDYMLCLGGTPNLEVDNVRDN